MLPHVFLFFTFCFHSIANSRYVILCVFFFDLSTYILKKTEEYFIFSETIPKSNPVTFSFFDLRITHPTFKYLIRLVLTYENCILFWIFTDVLAEIFKKFIRIKFIFLSYCFKLIFKCRKYENITACIDILYPSSFHLLFLLFV